MGAELASLLIFIHENISFWPTDSAIMKAYWATYHPKEAVPLSDLPENK